MRDVPDFAQEGFFGEDLGELLLSLGRESRQGPVPKRWRGLSGPKGLCFRNATELALEHKELLYIEGYAFADIAIRMPLAHAWLETPEGTVVDPTWSGGSGYFGIPFETDELREYLLLSEHYGVLQSLWRREMRECFFRRRGLQYLESSRALDRVSEL